MIWGIAAAILWGVADFSAALLSRRLRAIPTVLLVQTFGLVVVATLYVVVRPPWTADAADVALLVLDGALAAFAYIALYRGLALGPVALVSPIAASYAVVAIGLAVLVLGDRLGTAVLLASAVTVGGVALTSADPRSREAPRERGGVPNAVLAAVLFGVGTFILARSSREIGWLTTVLLGRTFTVLGIAALALWRREGVGHVDRRGLAGVAGLGLIDALGILTFAWGTEVALASLVIAASATFPFVSVAGGMLVLEERPARSQLVGIVFVVGGLVWLGLVS
ncbi:MAG: EamA family transporter [Actinomycetota bacterium]